MPYDSRYALTNSQLHDQKLRGALDDFMGYFKQVKQTRDEADKDALIKEISAAPVSSVGAQGGPFLGMDVAGMPTGIQNGPAGDANAQHAAEAKARYAMKYGQKPAGAADFMADDVMQGEKVKQAGLATTGMGQENAQRSQAIDLGAKINPIKVESAQTGLAKDKLDLGTETAIAPERIRGAKLGNDKTGQDLSQSSQLFPAKLADQNLQPSKTQAEIGKLDAEAVAAGKKPSAAGKLTSEETQTLTRFGAGTRMLDGLMQQYQDSDLGGKNIVQQGLNKTADVLSGVPLVGQGLAPKSTDYNLQKKLTAEEFLRQATGANAPEAEVKTYAGFLPDPGDKGKIATDKIMNFYNKVKNKALGVADAKRIAGDTETADALVQNINALGDSFMAKYTAPEPTGGVDKKALAQQALNDPEATTEEKAAAKRILGL